MGRYLLEEGALEGSYEVERELPTKQGDIFLITKYRRVVNTFYIEIDDNPGF